MSDFAEDTNVPTNDCISRQAAIDVIDKIFPVDPMRNEYTKGITCGAALAMEYIKQLPSAEPKKGKWERSNDKWKAACSFAPCKTAICSVCKKDTFDRIDYAKKHYKFCPFCGSKMEVTE